MGRMPLVQSGTPQTDQFASSSMKSTLGQPRPFFTEVERPAVINRTQPYTFLTHKSAAAERPAIGVFAADFKRCRPYVADGVRGAQTEARTRSPPRGIAREFPFGNSPRGSPTAILNRLGGPQLVGVILQRPAQSAPEDFTSINQCTRRLRSQQLDPSAVFIAQIVETPKNIQYDPLRGARSCGLMREFQQAP
jgi:hypothetical protein